MKKIIILSTAFISLLAIWVYSYSESYFVLWPSIDTQYSEDYNEQSFDSIRVGMTMQEVRDALGSPLNIEKLNKTQTLYMYSGDGRAVFGDFAWLNRNILFEEGKVIEKTKQIYHD